MEIAFCIIVQQPPVGIVFGLQKGTGNNYQTVQVQKAGSGNLIFNFNIEIKGVEGKDELPDFKGLFVHGPKLGRFIYIDIGTYAQHAGALVGGRMKIPLTGINWQLLEKAAGKGLQTHIPGTGKNGGPAYATVKPFEGWSIKES